MKKNIEGKVDIGTHIPQPKYDFYEEFCKKVPGKSTSYCFKYFNDPKCPKTCHYALEKEEEKIEKIRLEKESAKTL